jgi:hypothetical protein
MSTYEDDEFTRIEMESNARRLAVKYALQKLNEENVKLGLNYDVPFGRNLKITVPHITQEELDALNAEEK